MSSASSWTADPGSLTSLMTRCGYPRHLAMSGVVVPHMGRNYGGASGDGLRRRLVLLVAIFACTYVFVTVQRGDWTFPRDWQHGQGPTVAEVNDAPWAAWRRVSGVRIYDRGR